MKNRKLLIYISFFLLIVTGCSKNMRDTDNPEQPVEQPKPYTIVEDFETGSKSAYAAADIQLNTGIWNFNDALIGNLAADAKNGNKSVRLRTGSLTMNFDVSGITQIRLKHAKYGNDATSTWQLLVSADGGNTYTQ